MTRLFGAGPVTATPVSDDWISRQTMADVYPRAADPARPPAAPMDGCAPCPAGTRSIYDVFKLTTPGPRPYTIQRAQNFTVTAPVSPAAVPLLNNRFECDSFVVDVPSTAGQSAFIGFGSGVTTANGLELQPGLPILFQPENTREMWEIQRSLELICALLAAERGYTSLPQYRAPRVVFDASDWFVTSTVATTLSVICFTVPELQ